LWFCWNFVIFNYFYLLEPNAGLNTVGLARSESSPIPTATLYWHFRTSRLSFNTRVMANCIFCKSWISIVLSCWWTQPYIVFFKSLGVTLGIFGGLPLFIFVESLRRHALDHLSSPILILFDVWVSLSLKFFTFHVPFLIVSCIFWCSYINFLFPF